MNSLKQTMASTQAAESVAQAAGFEPDYQSSGMPLMWRRRTSRVTLTEAAMIARGEQIVERMRTVQEGR